MDNMKQKVDRFDHINNLLSYNFSIQNNTLRDYKNHLSQDEKNKIIQLTNKVSDYLLTLF